MEQTIFTHTPTNYADLEIRILERQDEGYPVEITFSGEQEFPRGYLTPDVVDWVRSGSPEEDGERLFVWLFSDDRLKTAWTEVRGQNPLRRIRLRIDASAPKLHAIPWELLRDARSGLIPQTLTAAVSTPFSRYLAGQWRPGHPILARPIKILVAFANPENLAKFHLEMLELEIERQTLESALSESGLDAEHVDITFLDQPVTLSALETELKKGYHILHLAAHGRFDKEQQHAELVLANKNNQVEWVSDNDFAEMFSRQEESLRLVFLASCQTATRSPADALRGFAPKLVAAGIPAVLAMQDLVSVNTAREFAGTFYRQIIRHGQVDLAGNEARSAVLAAKLSGASIPVLFMRLRSGTLFGQRGLILREDADIFWDILLKNIKDGECTPFLGSGVTQGLLPEPRELARSLARNYNYPFVNSDDLHHVAQFLGTLDNSRLRTDVIRLLSTGFKRRIGQSSSSEDDEKKGLSEIISSAGWSELMPGLTESEIHHQLADLELPLYITTNFDNFMTLALRALGKDPRRETIAWRETLHEKATPSYYDLDPPATSEDPVVLHLYGTDRDPYSMVLTEDDYLDYQSRISRDYRHLLPTSVQEALVSNTLLFLGYRLEDLDLRVLLRGLLTRLDLEKMDRLHVAVQIEATEVDEIKQKQVIRYFQTYFAKSRIDVYWGSAQQFVTDLHSRWQEAMES